MNEHGLTEAEIGRLLGEEFDPPVVHAVVLATGQLRREYQTVAPTVRAALAEFVGTQPEARRSEQQSWQLVPSAARFRCRRTPTTTPTGEPPCSPERQLSWPH